MRVGTIPLIKDSRGIQVCLVSTTKDPSLFTFPKGGIEEGEEYFDTALRELREEAGMRGKPILNKRAVLVESDLAPEKDTLYFFIKVNKIDKNWPEKYRRKRIQVYLDDLDKVPLNDKAQNILMQMRQMGLPETGKKLKPKKNLKKFLKSFMPKLSQNQTIRL
ncbi:NUDIX domain-containing protein [Curvivirga aplysinae]|uniref:NUDIX domain-containing protein n=1 Tax=Curvivirga aplysinae TaxID=2529852 RepID=UPI0012BD2646|nr:NUDIX domain-containing protein [Curvivirga aplysinae]MTI09512.1 NUDIX domain-containing protein [Curvivirga aplysinae]